MASPEQTDTFEQQNATGIGALLKASRLRTGEDLRDIAGVLKIRYVYLEAIDDGRFEDLPGATYTLGFVRAYAEHLGLDSAEVIRRFKSQESDADPRSQLDFPEPIPETPVPGGAVILIGVVVAVLAYGAWYVNSSEDGFFTDLIAPLPERFAKMSGPSKAVEKTEPEKAEPIKAEPEKAEPEQAAAQPAVDPKSEKTAETTSEPTPQLTPASPPESAEVPAPEKPPEPVSTEVSKPAPAATPAPSPEPTPASTPEPTAVTETVATPEPAPVVEPVRAPSVVPMDLIPSAARPVVEAAPAPASQATPASAPASVFTTDDAAETQTASTTPETPKPTPAAEEVSRIIVRAKTNSWIQVRDDTANELLLTRLLRAGDSYIVPGRTGLMLSTGNAGALEILVDGEAVPPIGAEGAVRRKILLDADKLKAGTAVSE